ncbi:MAG TPA: hypothetical protein VED40_05760 [Azospirillaceae bacterium]|nr:hypothetical protein [Azospirillaceae bacterium]
MIVETRHITFSPDALREALRQYRSLFPEKQPPGQVGRIWIRSQSPLVLEVSIQAIGATNFRELQMGENEVGGMLILYCRKAKIPLPRAGTKSIEARGDSLVLTVSKAMPVVRGD